MNSKNIYKGVGSYKGVGDFYKYLSLNFLKRLSYERYYQNIQALLRC